MLFDFRTETAERNVKNREERLCRDLRHTKLALSGALSPGHQRYEGLGAELEMSIYPCWIVSIAACSSPRACSIGKQPSMQSRRAHEASGFDLWMARILILGKMPLICNIVLIPLFLRRPVSRITRSATEFFNNSSSSRALQASPVISAPPTSVTIFLSSARAKPC